MSKNLIRMEIDGYMYDTQYPSHEIFCKTWSYEIRRLFVTKDGLLFFHVTSRGIGYTEDIIPCTAEEAKNFLISECPIIADFIKFICSNKDCNTKGESYDDTQKNI